MIFSCRTERPAVVLECASDKLLSRDDGGSGGFPGGLGRRHLGGMSSPSGDGVAPLLQACLGNEGKFMFEDWK